MKPISVLLVTLLLSFVCLSDGTAKDSSQWALPENAIARIGKGKIMDIAYSSDGKLLAVGTYIGTWLYDAHTWDELFCLTGHTQPVASIAFSPDGKTLASASYDKTIRLWNTKTGEHKATLTGFLGTVVFSPDGKTIATENYDVIQLWDAVTLKQKDALTKYSGGRLALAFSPDGKTLASIHADNTIRLWDVQTGEHKITLTGHKNSIGAVAFSPDGTILASGSWDNTVRLWNLKTEKLLATLMEHTRSINDLAFSPNGTILASGSWDNTVRLWNPKTGKLLETLSEHTESVTALAFSPDGRMLSSGSTDGTIRSWNLQTGEKHTLLHTLHMPLMALSPDNKTLATAENREIQLWDVNTCQQNASLTGHTDKITSIAFSQDEITFTSKSAKEHLLWDARTGTHLKKVIVPPDDIFWKGEIYSKVLSPDATTYVLDKKDGTIEFWNTQTRKFKTTPKKHTEWISMYAFSADGSMLATGGSDYTIQLWDVVAGKHKATIAKKVGPISALAFSRDGTMLASGNSSGGVYLWNLKTGAYTSTAGHQHLNPTGKNSINTLVFSVGDTTLASGSKDHTIRLWDTKTGNIRNTLVGHKGEVTSLMFSTTDEILVSSSNDGTILFWDVTPFVDTNAVVRISPSPVQSPNVGEQLTLNIDVSGAKNVTGYQVAVDFDRTALRYVSSKNGNYLASDTSFDVSIDELWKHPLNRLKLVSTGTSNEAKNTDGNLASITYEVIAQKVSTVNLPKVRLVKSDGSFARPVVVIGSIVPPSPKDGSAVDHTQFALPEGTKARLGKGIVNDIKLSPDKTLLAVASSIGTWLYDANTGDELALLKGHTMPVSVIAFSPHGDLLVSGSYDGKLRLWNPYTHKLLRTLKAVGNIAAVAFSSDGRTLANTTGDNIQLWDTQTGQHKLNIYLGGSSIFCLAFSPDGQMLASASLTDRIQLWDPNSGQQKFTLDNGRGGGTTSIVFNRGGPRLAFSPDGKILASTAVDNMRGNNERIKLWSTHTGELLATLVEEDRRGSVYPVSTVQFSADGKTLISGSRGGTLREWNLQTGENIKPFGKPEYGKFNLLPFLPDNTTLVRATQDNAIHLWDTKTGETLLTLIGYGGPINSIALSPDGTTLATVNDKRKIELWDMQARLNTGKIKKDGYFSPPVFSPDSATLASGMGNEIWLWDAKTRQHKATLKGHRGEVNAVEFSPNGQLLASSTHNIVRLWDLHTGKLKKTLQGHTSGINSITFSPDGAMIASGSGYRHDSTDSTVRLWNTKTGKQYAKFRNLDREHHKFPLPITTIAFSPDGKIIASIDRSADIQLWDIEKEKHISTLKSGSENSDRYYFTDSFALKFSPDGTTLTSTGYNSTIYVWNIETKKRQDTLTGHIGAVTSLAYSADGTTLVSGSADGTVLLWEMRKSPLTRLNITPFSIESPPTGKQLTFNINMTDGQNVNGYKFNLQYDATALRYIPNSESAPKIKNVKATPPVIAENSITLTGKATDGAIIEDGTITTVTFEVIKRADVTLTLTDAHLTHDNGERSLPIPGRAWVVEPPRILGDANHDWQLDATDLEFVSSRLGQTGKGNSADINKDGIVDLADLVLVANALNGTLPNHTTE